MPHWSFHLILGQAVITLFPEGVWEHAWKILKITLQIEPFYSIWAVIYYIFLVQT